MQNYKLLSYAAVYWGYHIRGDLEKDNSFQTMVVKTFLQTPGKLESMNQIRLYLKFRWRRTSTGGTLLHVIAEDGLLMLLKYMYEIFKLS